MSLFGKIFDRFGRHEDQSVIVGTVGVRPPDPLSLAATPASKAAQHDQSLPVAMPTGSAPLSTEENNRNQSTMDKR